jgi:uncharacterized membrane protein HdeD (DUF308 family)
MGTGIRSRSFWGSTAWVVLSLLVIAAGVIAIVAPFLAGVALTALIGWLLMFAGIVHVVFAWRSRTARSAIWQVLLGIAYGAAAFVLLTRPLVGLASLTLVLAAYLFAQAVLEFVLAFELRPARGTVWLFVDAAVTLVLALLIWMAWPFSTAWALGTLVGVAMIFSGVSRLVMYSTGRRTPVM